MWSFEVRSLARFGLDVGSMVVERLIAIGKGGWLEFGGVCGLEVFGVAILADRTSL